MDLQFNLKTVTPRSLKQLQELGLLNVDSETMRSKLIECCTDTALLAELCETIFQDDFSKVDFDSVDVARVHEGLSRFLLGFMQPKVK